MKKIYRLSPSNTIDDPDFWRVLCLRRPHIILDEYERTIAQIREAYPDDPRIPHLPNTERLIASVRKCIEARDDVAAMDCMVMLNRHVQWLDALFNAPVMKTGTKLRSSFARGREEANQMRHQMRTAEWEGWNSAAHELWARKPKATKAEIAQRVKDRLGLTEAVGSIARRLKKPRQAS